MKLLHTSDWHLGRMLYAKKERGEEQALFLQWLLDTIRENAVDALLIAGDIFDSTSPGNTSLKMYYDFLKQVRNCGCSHVVIAGGNHDSPSLLDAPKEVLSVLNVKVVGKACENIEDEVFVLTDENERSLAIVCAVPFLRERDISKYTEGETYSDRSKRIADCIRKHYEAVAAMAKNKQDEYGQDIPIIATGHLSVVGGKIIADDGVREIYIGGMECVESGIFPPEFDYVALGHYHIPSVISDSVRYCGSPIPMGFGEANQQKSVVMVDFENGNKTVTEIPIPVFQKLESIVGDKEVIFNRLQQLRESGESVWVEIIYDGNEIFADFAAWVAEQTADTKIEVLISRNKAYLDRVLMREDAVKSLEELNELDVFDQLLDEKDYPEEQKLELKDLYKEIINEMNESE
ncbi:MAG: exonuclease SbcCD subunit D C-terminal domain-containing protein [Candidatus Azobacteroides sp.]|nr:exonuclease SbcCD subunit D C-terminal domain-containing protein [Candidatus Azobacteroides sp.]